MQENNIHEKFPKFPLHRKEVAATAILVLGVALLAIVLFTPRAEETPPPKHAEQTEEDGKKFDPFANVSLEARAAYVWDARERRPLYSHNATAQLPLASLTKLATAFAAYTVLEPETTVTITPHAIAVEGDSGLEAGERWRAGDLLDFTLVSSSNDGAEAIAGAAAARLANDGQGGTPAFLKHMNDTAQALGLRQTYFINKTGLDPSRNVSGAYGSARDVAELMAHMVAAAPALLESTTYPELTFFSDRQRHTAENTNTMVADIPGLIASKTGFTDLAGGNLAVVFDAGIAHPIVVVVMGSTFDGRFRDIQKLVRASLRAVNQK